jgi:hypothetical protein
MSMQKRSTGTPAIQLASFECSATGALRALQPAEPGHPLPRSGLHIEEVDGIRESSSLAAKAGRL